MPTKPRRRRILDRIQITEISGVAKPAQEGANVVLLKSRDTNDMYDTTRNNAKLEKQVADLTDEVSRLTKQVTDFRTAAQALSAAPPAPPRQSFNERVRDYRKQGVGAAEAMTKARTDDPEAFAEAHLTEQERTYLKRLSAASRSAFLGKSPTQRREQMYRAGHLSKRQQMAYERGWTGFDDASQPGDVAPSIEKTEGDFETVVAEIAARDGIGKAEASTRARKEYPGLFKAYQSA